MNKKIITFLFFFLMIFNHNHVYAQTPSPLILIPGKDCGNSEATDSAKYCCQPVVFTAPGVPDTLKHIPGIGDAFSGLYQKINMLQSQTNIVPCAFGVPSKPGDPSCECIKSSKITPSPITSANELCNTYIKPSEIGDCNSCASGGGIWTAVGCIHGDFSRFISEILLSWGIGLAGLVALLCIIYAAFSMQTSRGNAEKIKKAQEMLTSCIMGLMLIIFSVFILRLIGVNILKIPGFN